MEIRRIDSGTDYEVVVYLEVPLGSKSGWPTSEGVYGI